MSVAAFTVLAMPDRITYGEFMAAVDHLMLAHSTEVHERSTPERQAATQHAYAVVAQMARVVTDRPEPPDEPEDDLRLPIRRGKP